MAVTMDEALGALREFVNDVNAAGGPDGIKDDWPDLVSTYQRACRVLRDAGWKVEEMLEAIEDDDFYETGIFFNEVVSGSEQYITGITIQTEFEPVAISDVIDAVRNGIIRWAKQYRDGKLPESNFNAGDLLNYIEDDELENCLREKGVVGVKEGAPNSSPAMDYWKIVVTQSDVDTAD